MSQTTPQLSRAHRVARGGGGAGIATLLAAASHGLAGGSITLPAVLVTAFVALPVCTVFAGRVGSLWRLSLAVIASQFLYHWSFAGIAATSGSSATSSGEVAPAHAAHLATAQAFAPAAAADSVMWTFHAVAALMTVAIVHRGERAFLSLMGMIRKAYTRPRIALIAIAHRPTLLCERSHSFGFSHRLFSAVSHRGPPLTV
ncbi:hypothetical protein G7066_09560 [Leucobacter coleopterorum]|uniref:Uncharacterized protein n=1 Tax=Leucobacter coleopterorum TaxID=2714933 RepID=A0ABX6JX10_9MICO|nr:hypothetical protein [Leucobacter coleopterorum]QIM18783.1 hypothetical protein G7066_09560 [Leucobacter coleopterorum]